MLSASITPKKINIIIDIDKRGASQATDIELECKKAFQQKIIIVLSPWAEDHHCVLKHLMLQTADKYVPIVNVDSTFPSPALKIACLRPNFTVLFPC